jgi:hypothetical protein
MKKKENTFKNLVGKRFESNNYFKYSRLERMILLTGFLIGFGKIDFILTLETPSNVLRSRDLSCGTQEIKSAFSLLLIRLHVS